MQRLTSWGRKYWVFAAALSLLALTFAGSSPAWAAPPSSAQYQTVPRPTPTPEDNPVATATPRPDDEDDDEENDTGGGDTSTGDSDAPVFLIAPEEGTADLTASVTVATLNMREGPGTDFPIVGALKSGDVVNVLWRNEDNSWWYVCCVPGTSDGGWVSARLLAPDFDRDTAADVILVFGTEVEAAAVESSEEVAATPEPSAVKIPITLKMSVSPPYLRQGQTADLVLEVSNPNLEEAISVELSDQLPLELELVDTLANGQGKVSEQTSSDGAPLLLVRWDSIPAGESVTATFTVKVDENLEDGVVFDNLAAVRGSNATYASAAVTVGMPPVLLPDFQ